MKRYWFVILFIISLAFVLRFYAASTLPIDYDESAYYTAANIYATAIHNGSFEDIINNDYNYEHPILSKLLYGIVISPLPLNEPFTGEGGEYIRFQRPLEKAHDPAKVFLLRLVSAFWGTLEVAVLAIISPIAAFWLAINSITIKYTSVIYLEALPAFLSLSAVVLFGLTTDWQNRKERLGWTKHWKESGLLLLSALCLGGAVASKYQYVIVGVAIAIFTLYRTIRNHPKDIERYGILIAYTAAALFFFFAMNPYLYTNPLGNLKESLLYSLNYSNSGNVKSAGYPFYQPLVWLSSSVPAFVDMPTQAMPSRGNEFIFQLDTFIFALAILGLGRMWKKHRLFFVWLILGLAFLLIWNTKWPQYTLLVTAPLCIAAADGLDTVIDWVKHAYSKIRRSSSGSKKDSPQ